MSPITVDEFEKAEVKGRETVTSEQVLEYIEATYQVDEEGAPVLHEETKLPLPDNDGVKLGFTTTDISKGIEVENREAVLNKLKALDKAGQIKSKKIGISYYWMSA